MTDGFGRLERPWDPIDIDTYVSCPRPLLPIFRIHYDEPRRVFAETLRKDHLRIEINDRAYQDEALEVCWRTIEPLAEAVDEGRVFMDDRPVAIARKAAFGLDFLTLYGAMIAFGWGDTSLPRTTVSKLERTLAEALASKLTKPLVDMMRRWENHGHLKSRKEPDR